MIGHWYNRLFGELATSLLVNFPINISPCYPNEQVTLINNGNPQLSPGLYSFELYRILTVIFIQIIFINYVSPGFECFPETSNLSVLY